MLAATNFHEANRNGRGMGSLLKVGSRGGNATAIAGKVIFLAINQSIRMGIRLFVPAGVVK